MNTEEAIETIEMLDENDDLGGIYIGKPIKLKIIDLLKRGEKFEKIVNELEKNYGYYHLVDRGKMCSPLTSLLDNIKQKYFPEGVNVNV